MMARTIRANQLIWSYFSRHRRAFLAGAFFLVLTQAFVLSVPRLLRFGIDALVDGSYHLVTTCALILVGVAACGAGVRILSRLLIFNSGRRVEYDLRNDLFDKLQTLSPDFYAKMGTAEIMSRTINDLSQVRFMLGPVILNVTNAAMVFLIVIPLLFLADAELAAIALLPIPVLIALGSFASRSMYRYSRARQERFAVLSAKVQENLEGVMTVRSYRHENTERETFDRLNADFVAESLRISKLRGFLFPTVGLCGSFSIVALLYVGGSKMIAGSMTVGQFAEFHAYLGLLIAPTINLGWMISLWQQGLAALDRIGEILKAPPSILSGPEAPNPLKGALELEKLTFSYPAEGSDRRSALNHLTTSFAPGKRYVIVGGTGSGKSTLLEVLVRFNPIDRQAVFLDGKDIVDLPLRHVRQAIRYAPQKAFLFSRTLFDNIAFGRPEASEEEVLSAAHRAGLESDIAGFRDGLQTIVGERGITLSGGQRQRVALARALIAQPSILLLDDTLSAVDAETEARLIDELFSQNNSFTVIIATHRLSCARYADRIIVLEEGAIVEQGTEEELLARHGVYARLHRLQRLREEIRQGGSA